MVMLLIIRNYLKLTFLTICYSAIFSLSFAQDKPKIQQQELYDNLIDEKCVARPRFDMLPPPGLPVDKMIYCNDQLVASVSAEKLTSIEEGEDFKAKLTASLYVSKRSTIVFLTVKNIMVGLNTSRPNMMYIRIPRNGPS